MPNKYTYLGVSVEQRFWSRVAKSPDGCWLWTGKPADNGYGQMTANSTPRSAHRWSWLLANGPIPEGLEVLHRCDNRLCVNPAHLFLGSQSDNLWDASRKGRIAHGSRHAAYLHPEKFSHLTPDDIREIRHLRWDMRLPTMTIAIRFGIDQSQVSRISRGITWKHIP